MKRQWLTGTRAGDGLTVVRRLAGVQAQVTSAAVAAVALRRSKRAAGEVDHLLSERSVMRTWAMRGTLHLLDVRDAGAYLSLLAATKVWEKGAWQKAFLKLDDVKRLTAAVEELLDGGQALTRAELVTGVVGHTGDTALGDHVASGWGAVLKPLAWQGILCNGPTAGGQVTFTAPADWVPDWSGIPEPDEAAAVAVPTYLGAHGPASPETFDQWLSRGASKRADLRGWFAQLGDQLTLVDVEGEELYARTEDVDGLHAARPNDTVRLLPPFDQYVLAPGTSDTHIIAPHRRSVVSRSAGRISPVVIAGGRVAGTWEVKDHRVDVQLFKEAAEVSRKVLEHEVETSAVLPGDGYTVSVTKV